MTCNIPISARRTQRQGGNEIVEFAVMLAFLVPTFLFVFINGMNLVRFIQCTQICRDVGNLYMQGTLDFSVYNTQAIAARLAQGYGLQIGSSFTGNEHTNSSNGGNGYVVLSQIMYVGPTTGASCQAVGASNCTNHDSYVYLQRIDFGNSALTFNGTTVSSKLGGNPTTCPGGGSPNCGMSPQGSVSNYLTDAKAVATNMPSLVNSQFSDGQVAYVVETFFASPDLGISAMPTGGIYQRIFF